MCLDCREADDERRGDLVVRQAAGDEHEHLALALGQLAKLLGDAGARRRSAHVLGDQPLGEARREQRLAGGDDVDRVDEPVGRASP